MLLDGKEVMAQMMRKEFWRLNYMETDSVWAVELPYYSRPVSMVIMVPREYGRAAFLKLEQEFYRYWRAFQLGRRAPYEVPLLPCQRLNLRRTTIFQVNWRMWAHNR